jgi:hypothetical protein
MAPSSQELEPPANSGRFIAIFGVAFMLGDHLVIGVMLLLLAWVLVMLDGPLEF